MTVESASYISQLDTTLPTASNLISEGDDHLRLTKTVLKTQFPNFGTTAIAASAVEVNYCVGVTSAIQMQLNTKAPTASPTFTGTAALPATTSIGTVSDVEIATLDGVTSSIQTQLNSKGASAGQVWTGAHDFTSAAISVPTATAGDSSSKAASTAFVVGTAFSAALPGQAGSAGRYLTTDGTSASWASLEIDALSITYNGNGSIATLTEDGVVKTFAYNGDGTINTVSWPVGALTRTETYSYSAGVLNGMTAVEA